MIFKSANKKKKETKGGKAFTLIEVIVSVVVLAILASMVVTFFGSSITKSSAPILGLKKSTDLRRVMANITADYKKYPIWKAGSSYSKDNEDIVIPTPYHVIGQRYYYKCTTSGTSGSNEPAWTGSGTVNDQSPLVWTCQGKLATLDDLETKIGVEDPSNKKYDYGYDGKSCSSSSDCSSGSICESGKCKYGYYVIEKNRIEFDASNIEQKVTNGNILKITIKSDSGEILSALFF